MPTPTPDIVRHACELFAPMGTIHVRRMFGGWGFYLDDLFFAIVAWEMLYLKADGDTEQHFIRAGSEQFRYQRPDGKEFAMGYWTAPEEAFDSPAAMAPWSRLAIDCALRHRKVKPAGRAKRKPPATRG